MPLEMKAWLDRPVGIYLAGETVRIKVSIRHLSPEELSPKKRRALVDGGAGKQMETIAWASVQLGCERVLGAGVSATGKETTHTENGRVTAMPRSAHTVFACRPAVLFCDLRLAQGERREFECTQRIPRPDEEEVPPTHRGQLVKYLYRITLAMQLVNMPIRLQHLPIRVLPAVGLTTPPKALAAASNPFLAATAVEPSVTALVSEAVDTMTAPRRATVYALTNSAGRVATLTLFKKAYRLGEDVIGHLDFSDAASACVQFVAALESEERLIDSPAGAQADAEGRCAVATAATEQRTCAFAKDAAFRLPIPMHATPTFHTDLVHVKWRLRFEFVTTSKIYTSHEGASYAPTDVPIETLCWQLDICVFPCSPQNAALTDFAHPNTAVMRI